MSAGKGWLEDLAARVRSAGTLVRVTVIKADGSTPREVGAAMLVDREGQSGTIGGGALELEATHHARALLADAADVAPAWQREARDFALGPSLGQCCGGHTRILFEIFTAREAAHLAGLAEADSVEAGLILRPLATGTPIQLLRDRRSAARDVPARALRVARDILTGVRPRQAECVAAKGETTWFIEPCAARRVPLYVYGAGHVGRALLRVLEGLPFDVTWVDIEPARFPDAIPAYARMLAAADPAAAAATAPAGAFHIVLTFSHAIDLAICFALLKRDDFAFLGLIGSATKRARFLKRLREAGVSDAALARLICPIGIAGITGKQPAVIAVSVAAQLAAQASYGVASPAVRTERTS